MTPMAIAGVQMQVSMSHSNIPAMRHKLDSLMFRYPWVQMVVFSELCAYGPDPRHAETLPGPAEGAFCEMAARHGVWLIPGSLFERVGHQIYNTAPVIDPSGTVVARYRKMFPFRPYEINIEAGTDFVVFDVPGIGRIGISICYDMWFPETTRTLAAMGAEVIVHPTLTDTLDRDVELSIARASAATNQCYFFDVNGVGEGGYGRSIIVGPQGYVIHEAGSSEEMMPVEVNLDRVRREREFGIHGLGQPLKSFRDRAVDFNVYRTEAFAYSYFHTLGPLEKPARTRQLGTETAPDHPSPESGFDPSASDGT